MIFLDLWLQDKGIIHTDHFTEDYLPKGIKTVVQNEEDEQIIRTIACLHFQIPSSSAIAAPYHSSSKTALSKTTWTFLSAYRNIGLALRNKKIASLAVNRFLDFLQFQRSLKI